MKNFSRTGNFYKMNRINQSDRATGKPSFNCLSKTHIGIHPASRCNKPGFEMFFCCMNVLVIARKKISRGECSNNIRQPKNSFAMRHKISRIRLPITLNIGSFSIFRIWPPIITFRIKIIDTPGASPATGCCHSLWCYG